MLETMEAPQQAPAAPSQAPIAPAPSPAPPVAEAPSVLTPANESFFPNGRIMYGKVDATQASPDAPAAQPAPTGGHPGDPADGTQALSPKITTSPQISGTNFPESSTNPALQSSPSPVYHASGALGRTLELDPGVGERTLGALREYEGTIRRFQSEKDRLEARVREISAQPQAPAVDMEALAAFALETGLDQTAFQRLAGIVKANGGGNHAGNGNGPQNPSASPLPVEDQALLSQLRAEREQTERARAEQARQQQVHVEVAALASGYMRTAERFAPGSMAGIDAREIAPLIAQAAREVKAAGREHEFPMEVLFETAVEAIRRTRGVPAAANVTPVAQAAVQRAPIPVSSGGGVPPGMVSPQRMNGQAPGAAPVRVVNSGMPGGAAPGTPAFYAEKARANGIQMPNWLG